MAEKIHDKQLSDKLDAFLNAGCDFARACFQSWLARQDQTEASTPIAPSSNNKKELTAPDQADIMTTLRSDRNQPQEQTVSVYKRDKRGKRVKDSEPGTWCYDFTEEGIRHRKSLPKVKTKKEAKAVERHAQHKVQTGAADQETIQTLKGQVAELNAELKKINSNKAGEEIRFEDFIKTVYLPEKKTFNPETYAHCEHITKIFCAYFKGRLVHEITPGDIRAFRQERASSKTKKGRDRAIGTLNRERAQLSGVFQLAVDNGYITNNPARKVKSLPVDNAREKVLEREEEAKLFAALTGKDAKLKPIATLALYAGLRLGEALNLTWEQVDMSEGENGRKLTIKGKGRGRKKKKRIVPLRAVPFKLLQDLRAECEGKGRIFTARGLHPITVSKRFSAICDEIGLPDVTMHTLRHTFLTRFVDVVGNAAHAQRVAGHSDLTTTQRYLHPGEKAVRESMKKMDDWEAEKAVSMPIPDAIADTNSESPK